MKDKIMNMFISLKMIRENNENKCEKNQRVIKKDERVNIKSMTREE
jgi:hypothetical protein